MQLTKADNQHIVIWLLAALVAAIAAMNYLPAALVGGEYIPVSNDSFYHARRIIDTATGERPFYQFDPMIHAPDGSWLTWPWGYDYIVAQALKIALWLDPDIQPMAFLAYVPVFWLLVNTGLMTLVARAAGLSTGLVAVVMAGFAVSPLTQGLHGVGFIDHHFAELTFVLLSLWSGLRFMSDPTSRSFAIVLGVSLGLSHAVHNSLFILQIPVLVAFFLQWLRGDRALFQNTDALAASLFLSTLAVVLPSEPFRELFFEFATLSTFHLYVAFCSASGLVILKRFPFSRRNAAIAGVLLCVLAIPLAIPFVIGVNYVAGQQIGLDYIIEVAGPYEKMLDAGTHRAGTLVYGLLIFIVPLLMLFYLWMIVRGANNAARVFLGVSGFLGLCMLVSQYRFHPFGSWAVLVGTASWIGLTVERHTSKPAIATGIAALVFGVAMTLPVTVQLGKPVLPSASREYAVVMPMLYALADACEEDPGIALGASDDGHPIRYHTDCSVIMNNFLLTPQHGEKLIFGSAMLQLSPNELLLHAPYIRYLLVHIYDIYTPSEDGPLPTPLDVLKTTNSPLFYALAVEGEVPPNFKLIAESRVEDERDIAYAQVYRIDPPASR